MWSVSVSVILGVRGFYLGVCIIVVGKGAKINLSVEIEWIRGRYFYSVAVEKHFIHRPKGPGIPF